AGRVFASGLETTMIGLDVTHRAVLDADRVEGLRAAGGVGKVVAERLDFFGRFHAERYPELGGSPLHDPVAVAHVIDPGLLELRAAHGEVDGGGGAGRGRTNVDARGRRPDRAPNAHVAVG